MDLFSFTLTIAPLAGAEISDVIHEAKLLARHLHCGVTFRFNDISIYVWPQSDEGQVYHDYLVDRKRS